MFFPPLEEYSFFGDVLNLPIKLARMQNGEIRKVGCLVLSRFARNVINCNTFLVFLRSWRESWVRKSW